MSATAANVHDVTEAHNLLHGGEKVVWGDAGYQGVEKREENLGLEVERRVAMRPGRRWKLEPENVEALAEKVKAQVRAKVEHPFLRLKRLFGYVKVHYRGLAKNAARLALLFGLGNLLTAEGQLRAQCTRRQARTGPLARAKPPTAPSGAKLKGKSACHQCPDGSSRPLTAPSNTSQAKRVLFRISLGLFGGVRKRLERAVGRSRSLDESWRTVC